MLPVLRRTHSGWTTPSGARPFQRFETFLDRMVEDVDKVLENVNVPTLTWGGLPIAVWEDADWFTIEVDVPGVKQDEIDLTIHQGVLTVRGERKPAEGRKYLHNSQTYGKFERVVSLPETVDADRHEANLVDGVLQVRFAKSPAAQPKKIAIQRNA